MPRDAIFSKPFSCTRIRKLLRIRHHVISPFHELEHGKQRAPLHARGSRRNADGDTFTARILPVRNQHTFSCSMGSQGMVRNRISQLDGALNLRYTPVYTHRTFHGAKDQRFTARRPRALPTRQFSRQEIRAGSVRESSRHFEIAARIRSEVFRSSHRSGSSRGSAGSTARSDQEGRKLGAADLLQPGSSSASARRSDGGIATR